MKYWVFDLDGTLVDSFEKFFSIVESILNRKMTTDERFITLSVDPSVYFSQWLGPKKVNEALLMLRQKSKESSNSISPFENMSSILVRIHSSGDKIAVWTSRGYESAELVLINNGFNKYISTLVSGDCVSNKKPHPEGLIKIQKHFGCLTEEMIMVGDHTHDMEAAKALGVFAVRASWHQHWNEAECQLSDRQFKNTHEFSEWIKSLN